MVRTRKQACPSCQPVCAELSPPQRGLPWTSLTLCVYLLISVPIPPRSQAP